MKVKASVEGYPTEALIDTGSHVSLVSTDFLLCALDKIMDDGGTEENITKALRERLEDPQLNFGGDEVHTYVVGQATVTVGCEEHKSQISERYTVRTLAWHQYSIFQGSLASKSYNWEITQFQWRWEITQFVVYSSCEAG